MSTSYTFGKWSPQQQVPQQQVPAQQAQAQPNLYVAAAANLGAQAGENVPPAQVQNNYSRIRNNFKRGHTN